MKSKFLYAMLAVVFAVSLVGCSTLPPFMGILYTNVKYPHGGQSVSTEDGALGGKEGRASSHFILGLVAFGDSSVKGAAYKGGITKIKTVDHEYISVLGIIYGQYTTVVTGD